MEHSKPPDSKLARLAPTRAARKYHEWVQSRVRNLQRFVDRKWYPLVLGILAALDNFIVIVPTDGILISSSMLVPRRWFTMAINLAVGSTLGAAVLAALVEWHGLPWIVGIFPGVDTTQTWAITAEFFGKYGLAVVFAIAMAPLMQQPAIILAALANTNLIYLTAVVFVGRSIKFFVMAYVASHTPKLLTRLWGVKGEMRDAGIDV